MIWDETRDRVNRPLWVRRDKQVRISKRGRRFYLLKLETKLVPQGIYDTIEEAKEAGEK